ncbi:N-acetylmuramoyl-L-alanine amidase [Desulfofundulus australicus DSM 11792]|uniref:Spore cortex-lytic enzyme n=2 Tax=Peptococcaceae TaxID=186807 RepID=A0A1M4YNQ3_9FIRM|nr:N-acetylmuramoyl-L-alanine amidase [Thermoanaerobacter sp.]SHF07424.1 N-acetylmuramoyl-L-alanine amidase [Desulfofundulus australicus DSM 11792]
MKAGGDYLRRSILIAITLAVLAAGMSALTGQTHAQERILYWGLSGEDVIRVQQRLKEWGYYNGPVDGFYGNETQQAVVNFQLNNGLVPDGTVGPETWAALGFSPAPAASPPGEPAGVSRGVTNRDEVYLLARVIEGEAADEPLLGKVAVGAVILNRTRCAAFPNSLAGVIYQPHAFESVSNGQYNRPVSEESLQAAMMAMCGWDPTGGCLYFWNPAKPVNPWIWTRDVVTQIGRHIFAR